tara:strand:+ start:602 stop:997 length:396 start_codon:yes stop_codon:yes gene_type:complete
MASILKVDSIGKTSGSTQDTMAGLAKSWFIFDQVNSNTLDDSFNIGSITDRGTGSMYGNFTNNMNTINYTVMAASSPVASGSMATNNTNRSSVSSADTTARSSVNIFVTNDVGSGGEDEENQQSVVHGDLA